MTGNLALLTQIYLEPGSRLKGFGATATGINSDPNKSASLHFYSGALAETIAEIEFENDGNVEVALNEIIRIDANYFLRANISNASSSAPPQIGPIYFIYESNH